MYQPPRLLFVRPSRRRRGPVHLIRGDFTRAPSFTGRLLRPDTQYHPAFAWPVVVGRSRGAESLSRLSAVRGSEPVAALDVERHGVKITPVGVEVFE
jgi:hypothetical protein